MNSVEKCLFEENIFSNCMTTNIGGSIFISSSITFLSMYKICGENCSTTTNNHGQFHYSNLNPNGYHTFDLISTNKCSYQNSGYSVINIQQGSIIYHNSNTSKHNLYHIINVFFTLNNNLIDISYSNFNSNVLSAYLVL